MAVKPEAIKVGDTLYLMGRQRMGNTTMSRDTVSRLTIKAIESNGAGPVSFSTTQGDFAPWRIARWSRSPKEWVRHGLGEYGCAICHARKEDGHRDTCTHPAAVRARKAAVKL